MTNRPIGLIVKEQNPVTLSSRATLRQACKLMAERGVGAVLVTDGHGLLRGIFTGRDAVRALGQGLDPAATTLHTVMTRNPRTVAPNSTAIDALRMMSDCGFRHLPVVENERILGIVSRGDFKGLELDRLEAETALWERIA
jgi:CBS domain-containing protein